MPGVFISYRREDSPGHAGRVFDRIRARLGGDVVFMDVTAIEAGVDFVDAIERAVGVCDVLLAMIGPRWVNAVDQAGRRRLDNANDFIRLEIAGALKRKVRVIPVLVGNAELPAPEDLPDDLKPLLRRNAVELRDSRWDADIDQLVASIERLVTPAQGAPVAPPSAPAPAPAANRSRVRMFGAVAALAVVVVAGALLGPRGCAAAPDDSTRSSPPPVATEKPADIAGASTGADSTLAGTAPPPAPASRLPTTTAPPRPAGGTSESAGPRPAVRASVVVSHRPEDADLARRLVALLQSSPSGVGLAIRANETPQVRAESLARVVYRDADLEATAAALARDASTWLRQTDPTRPPLTPGVYERVAGRALVIGLPSSSGAAVATGSVPDVRGRSLAEARRLLTGAGPVTLSYRWLEDRARPALEVVGQTELPSRTPGTRLVALEVVAKATLFVEYVERDRPTVERLARELRANRVLEGVALRLQPVATVKPPLIGKVVNDGSVSSEAASIARFASSWLSREAGRAVTIQGTTDRTAAPRTMLFGVPPL